MSSPPLPATALTSWRLACGPPVLTVEFVPLAEGVGRILARPLDALCDSPAHEAAAMDGIAVRARDTVALRLPAGSYDLVDTGDAIPAGRDAVVVREQVSFRPDGIGGAECAVLAAAVPVGRHVRTVGEDVRTGELLLDAGLRLRPVDLALAAAGGHTGLPVLRRPHVVVIPTGDEVLPLGSRPGPGQVLDTNSLMLVAQAGEAGCTAVASPVVPDQPAALTEAVRQAARTADLVVVIAGSSAGRDDHTASVVATAGTLVVHGVAVRPGHPVVLGVVDATPVLGAPGYPVSAALSFELFAIPLLADLAGTQRGSGLDEPPGWRLTSARRWPWTTGCGSGSTATWPRHCPAARAGWRSWRTLTGCCWSPPAWPAMPAEISCRWSCWTGRRLGR